MIVVYDTFSPGGIAREGWLASALISYAASALVSLTPHRESHSPIAPTTRGRVCDAFTRGPLLKGASTPARVGARRRSSPKPLNPRERVIWGARCEWGWGWGERERERARRERSGRERERERDEAVTTLRRMTTKRW